MKRPASLSRDSYTLFPAGISPKSHNTSHTSLTSERMGAFGTMQLDGEQRALTPTSLSHSHQRSSSQPPIIYTPIQQNTPIMGGPGYAPVPRAANNYTMEPKRPTSFAFEQHPYQPTVSNADTTDTRRKHDLQEVYSMSDDTVAFAKNFSEYLNEKIPYGFTIGALALMCIVAFALTLVGALNIPFCPVQPLIPIWLMLSGVLFIISASIRMIRHIPEPTQRRQRRSDKKKRLSTSLCITAFELLFLFINLIWLILGCVWVYGSRFYVHFRDQLFEEHYCDSGLYYTAFAAVTAYLVSFNSKTLRVKIFVCVLILALICILFVGSCKEANSSQNLS